MLYDRLLENWGKVLEHIGSEDRRHGRINTMTWDDIYNLLAEAIVIDIENVAQYLNREINTSFSVPELLNIRPIFPVMWLEWKHGLLGKKATRLFQPLPPPKTILTVASPIPKKLSPPLSNRSTFTREDYSQLVKRFGGQHCASELNSLFERENAKFVS